MAYFTTSDKRRDRRAFTGGFDQILGPLALVASFSFVVALVISL
jgi:hypothetical protein